MQRLARLLQPPEPLERQTWVALGLICCSSFASNWDLSTFSLALPQIQESFGLVNEATVSRFAATVRAGALFSIFITMLADRAEVQPTLQGRRCGIFGGGRQGVFTFTIVGLAAMTALSSAAPSAAWLCAAQVAARALGTAESMLAVVLLVEATPPACRGYCMGVHMLAGAAGYGAGTMAYAHLLGSWRECYLASSAVCAAVALARWRLLLGAQHLPCQAPPLKGAPAADGKAGISVASSDGGGSGSERTDGGDNEADAEQPLLSPTLIDSKEEEEEAEKEEAEEEAAVCLGRRSSTSRARRLPPAALQATCALFVPLALGLSPATALFSPYLQNERGLSPAEVGAALLTRGPLAMGLSVLVASRSDAWGRPRTAAAATALAVVGYGAAYSAALPLELCLIGWVVGLGAFAQASMQLSALVTELFPRRVRGLAAGASEIIFTLAGSAGLWAEAALCEERGEQGQSSSSGGAEHSPGIRLLAPLALGTSAACLGLLPLGPGLRREVK